MYSVKLTSLAFFFSSSTSVAFLCAACALQSQWLFGLNVNANVSFSNICLLLEVQLLLSHGADPNQRDSLGNTPLHLGEKDSPRSLAYTTLVSV